MTDERQVVVHVGLHKTGTTIIQEVLHQQRVRLAQRDVHFVGPQHDLFSHFRVWRTLLDSDHHGSLIEQGASTISGLVEAVLRPVHTHNGTSILSYEGFLGSRPAGSIDRDDLHAFDHGVHPFYPHVERRCEWLRDALSAQDVNARIVVALGPQGRWIRSLYNQYVRAVQGQLSLDEFLDRVPFDALSWAPVVDALDACFGAERVSLMWLGAERLVPVDYIQQFLRHGCGIDAEIPESLLRHGLRETAQDTNLSPGRDSLELMRFGNQLFADLPGHRRALRSFIERELAPRQEPGIHADRLDEIDALYLEENEQFAARSVLRQGSAALRATPARPAAGSVSKVQPKTLLLSMGSAKAGTTWLYRYAEKHPDIAVSPLKELHYYDTAFSGFDLVPRWNQVLERRLAVAEERSSRARRSDREGVRDDFDNAPKTAALARRLERLPDTDPADPNPYLDYFEPYWQGESVLADLTPGYQVLSLDQLRTVCDAHPNAKAIFLMREPVDRLYSQMRMADRTQERRNAAEERMRIAFKRPSSQPRADYAATVQRLDAVFGERVAYFYFEELFADDSIRRLCEFLDIDFVPGEYGNRRNAAPTETVVPADLLAEGRAALAEQYAFCEERFGYVPDAWKMSDDN